MQFPVSQGRLAVLQTGCLAVWQSGNKSICEREMSLSGNLANLTQVEETKWNSGNLTIETALFESLSSQFCVVKFILLRAMVKLSDVDIYFKVFAGVHPCSALHCSTISS